MALVQVNFFSESLLRNVNITCIIPNDKREMDGEGLRPADKPFKTLYLLHGIYSGEWDWLTQTRLFKYAKDRNLAVILPCGENGFYNDSLARHDLYSKFIGEELVCYTRSLFHLSDKREDTFIGGLSMGGLGAFETAMRYPETFGYVGALSTATMAQEGFPKEDDPSMYLLSSRTFFETVYGPEATFNGGPNDVYKLADDLKASGKELPKIFMAIGVDDPLLAGNRRYHEYLEKIGIPVDYSEDKGAHDWGFWDRNLYRLLDWLPVEQYPKKRVFDF